MMWIGITGGMGCGKSTVNAFLKKQGFSVVSADDIVRDLYLRPEVISKVAKLLEIEQSKLSKEKIAEAVFSDKRKLKALEDYMHPLVRIETERWKKKFEKSGDDLAFYEVPLLFEKNMQSLFDYTVCVGTDSKIQWERIKNRNSWSDEEIRKRLSSQMSLEKKRGLADYYIDNSSNLEDLKTSCRDMIIAIRKSELELK